MKSTGIVRKIDELGRVVLPIELRRNLNIKEKDEIEIYVDGEKIVLQKHNPCDVFSGETEDLVEYKGKLVSKNTIKELLKLL